MNEKIGITQFACPIVVESDDLIPEYGTEHSAGCDLKANIDECMILSKGERLLVPTGIKIQCPVGFHAEVRPRSGLAYKHGITVLNSPGTIDSDYRGDIGVILINHGSESFVIEPRMKIAQLVFTWYVKAVWANPEELTETERGEGGFGSTGV